MPAFLAPWTLSCCYHTRPDCCLAASRENGENAGSVQEEALSLISRSVNNKNIDITRVYQCAAAFEVHFAF